MRNTEGENPSVLLHILTRFDMDARIKTPHWGGGAATEAAGGRHFLKKEVTRMVTWNEVFTFSLVLIGFAGLIVQICKKK